ncbi:unnamed protein product [Darwinula stevensoni]|uniref:Ig-like domain-containing protein n=1 Tax=Darwinula stevensoni TaxID=69355 RepID=A0A7R8X052_9CRUS|nr:unnamed protein product [Darwinula stevensoni]CAG0880849.1 unnamed protein product [Darwinula stevensoni]
MPRGLHAGTQPIHSHVQDLPKMAAELVSLEAAKASPETYTLYTLYARRWFPSELPGQVAILSSTGVEESRGTKAMYHVPFVPQVLMVAGNEMVVESGARVDIRCQIRGTTQVPKDVGWYRNGQELVGIIYTSKARKNENSTDPGETYFSTYLIPNARMGDSGNYTCRPQDLPEASIQLHVTRGDIVVLNSCDELRLKRENAGGHATQRERCYPNCPFLEDIPYSSKHILVDMAKILEDLPR